MLYFQETIHIVYQKLSIIPEGITYILKKYAKSAGIVNSQLIPKIISLYVFRHSKAMHLLQG
ncbi:site-specific recombinase XerD [Chryseobacterium sp. BIGb0186]|nr:site-specific recombinase XerD [Chryseobacterium sp. JUb44]MDH6209636.1 site-specific recombinase XerD [Chryseobacterium sp. BIGb0186]